jgi:transcriptional accessory protein Tex/SPT6
MQTTLLPTTPGSGAELPLDLSRIAQDLQIRKVQVESVVRLLDEDNTVPFITRYRKERTGGLNEDVIRAVQVRVQQLRQLAERKQTVLKSIEGQGKLTDELRAEILAAETPKRLEDLYLPYKPKKRTVATAARERGLEPLATAIWSRDPAVANLQEILSTFVNPEKGLATPDEVLLGVQHILAEQISETAEVRAAVRVVLWETGKLCTAKSEKLAENQGLDYKDYFQFSETIRHIPPHRILAINRGEKENALQARLDFDVEGVPRAALSKLPLADHPHKEFLERVAADALARLILPSLDREIRRELTQVAENHAVGVFARNLRSLLLAAPLRGRRVLAIDPGFRTGCKLAVLDENGRQLEDAVIFPHAPQNKKDEARAKLEQLARKHQVHVIAIGNGTACRETEEVVSEVIVYLEKVRKGELPPPVSAAPAAPTVTPASPTAEAAAPPADATTSAPLPADQAVPPVAGDAPSVDSAVSQRSPAPTPPPLPPAPPEPPLPDALPDLAYVIVNEAGASVYSASPIGREEFPNYDATLRGTISIGRRLQDPLSEYVKIDPQSIGVGLYQHDVNPRLLKDSLDAVIEACVNTVGVDLNTASVPLLRHISGLNQLVARTLVDYRTQNGAFKNRSQLLQVPNIGDARYVQAAGFLKITGGDDPLDQTWIHPESYLAARQLLGELGASPEALLDKEKMEELRAKLKTVVPEEIAARLQIGVPTLRDILEALARPGRDPRDDLPPPIFKKGILKLEDLQAGMELKGTVLNVVDFGAFIDIGLKEGGLAHISQMANRYIKSPHEIVSVGDVVTVWVLSVEQDRRRVRLTLIKPGTERKPPERKPQPPRQEGERRPPRGRRPPPRGDRRPPAPTSPPHPAGAEAPAPVAAPSVRSAPPPRPQQRPPQRPPLPPRKPSRPQPKPKLTQAALEGEAPLRTFRELMAFYEARDTDEQPAAASTPVPNVAPEPEPAAATAPADNHPQPPASAT